MLASLFMSKSPLSPVSPQIEALVKIGINVSENHPPLFVILGTEIACPQPSHALPSDARRGAPRYPARQ